MIVQTTDLIATSATGYSFTTPNDHFVVAAGVIVSSNTSAGIGSNLDGSKVTNYGNVYSASSIGIGLDDQGLIVNFGTIGGATGVNMSGNAQKLTNFGEISGSTSGIVLPSAAVGAVITNDGTIWGGSRAIVDDSGSDGAYVLNRGLIDSAESGIVVQTAAGVTTEIVNEGVIRGLSEAIYGNEGQVFLTNTGRLIGRIELSPTLSGDDLVYNAGRIDGVVGLGTGKDYFNGTGGRSGVISGEQGNDRLMGGSFADHFVGGQGRDVLTGAAGGDRFAFWFATETAPGGRRDVVTDFHHSQRDKLDFSAMDILTGPPGQGFHFIGAQSFASYRAAHPTEFGLLRFANGVLQGTNDADLAVDFEVRLPGVANLVASDFVL